MLKTSQLMNGIIDSRSCANPKQINLKHSLPEYIKIKLPKIKEKKTLKAASGKEYIIFMGKRLKWFFMEARRKWHHIFQGLKEKLSACNSVASENIFQE